MYLLLCHYVYYFIPVTCAAFVLCIVVCLVANEPSAAGSSLFEAFDLCEMSFDFSVNKTKFSLDASIKI